MMQLVSNFHKEIGNKTVNCYHDVFQKAKKPMVETIKSAISLVGSVIF